MNIPLELFFGFIGVSFVFFIIGLAMKKPEMLIVSGIFMLALTLSTTEIGLGQLVNNSTYSGNFTQYQYIPDNFEFTELPKTLFAIFAGVFMLIGAILMNENRKGDYPFE